MNKGHSYFELLDALKEAGCPICRLVIKDSHSYLDHILYESVLDVPTRMKLMGSFGFCNWHTWQLPSLPEICSPSTGYSIFASDLLRKFMFLTREITEKLKKKRGLKSLLTKISRRFLFQIKERLCPACRHAAQFESYHLKDLADSLGEEDFLQAYQASDGICLPHFFLLEKDYSAYPNFPLLVGLQLHKARSLRDTLEEFIRKQDHRFRHEITSEEAKAWRVAMEFLSGKPGVFANEMKHDLLRPQADVVTSDEISLARAPYAQATLRDLIDEMKTSKEVVFYLKHPFPSDLFESLQEATCEEAHAAVEAVVEDFNDVEYLRRLHSAGFSLFYGIGLSPQTIVFLDRKRGFLLEERQQSTRSLRPLKNPEELYLSLLWRRFGIAVLFSGLITDHDVPRKLFSLTIEGKREQWCRLKDGLKMEVPPVGAKVEVFAWERWAIQILEVLEITVLEANGAMPG